MANLSDKINAARSEGYSDEEIIKHLSSTDLRPKIDAAMKEGYSAKEIADHLSAAPAPVSGIVDQFWGGLESNTENPGVSLELMGKTMGNETVQNMGTALRNVSRAPKNFVSGTDRFIHPQEGDSYVDPILGFGWGSLPNMAAETAGQLTGNMAARGAGAGAGAGVGFVAGGPAGAALGAKIGSFGGPALLGFMSTVGPVALERARNNGREEPSWDDWTWAAGTGAGVGILDAIGVGRLGLLNSSLKEVGKTTTKEIVTETAKDIGKSVGREALVGSGQSAIQQVGETANTDKGLSIDLKRVVGEGIGSGLGAGIADIGRRSVPTVRVLNDSIQTDRNMRNNPDAQAQAEITLDVNAIADRMKGSGKAPVSKEIGAYTTDLRRQIAEAIDGQRLPDEDKKALKQGMQDATGLTPDRLDEIAGRSDSPDAIKSLARKIQVVREMTMQKQTAKGLRGAVASAMYHGGAPTGAAIGNAIGMPAAGAFIGDAVGTAAARYLRNSQTQGAAIDNLVGKKQARRAKMLLDRYGPSEATRALDSLTQKAAANKAQDAQDAQAKADFEDTMSKIRQWQSLREKSKKAEQQAKTAEERAAAKADKAKYDSAYREARLKDMATRAAINAARKERLAQDLEHKQATNALTVEFQQLRNELAQKQAEAKAQGMDRDKQAEIARIKGRMEMAALDISRRQEALKKAQIATKRAQIQLDRLQSKDKPNVQRMAKAAKARMGKMPPEATVDQYGNPIRNEAAFQEKKQHIQSLQNEGMAAAEQFPDKALGNLFIEAISDFKTYTGRKNQEKRMAVYERVLRKVPPDNVDAHRFIAQYIRPLALAFDAEGYASGMEDAGAPPPFEPPPAAAQPPPAAVETPLPPPAPPFPTRQRQAPPPVQEAPPPPKVEQPGVTYGDMLRKPKNSHHMFIGPFGFSFEANHKGRYLWLTTEKGQKAFQSVDGGPPDSETTHVWSFKDPNEGNSRTGPKVGINSLGNNVPPDLVPIFRAWLDGKIDEAEAISRIKRAKRGGTSGEQDPPF